MRDWLAEWWLYTVAVGLIGAFLVLIVFSDLMALQGCS